MRVTDFTSMFHESGFVFVAERASENRNGNREPSTRTKAEIKAGKKNPDPRDHSSRRGSASRYDGNYDTNAAYRNAVHGENKNDENWDKASNDLKRANRNNIPGSSNIRKAENRVNTYRKANNDKKALEKIRKYCEM